MAAFAELLCPNCSKHWEVSPSDVDDPAGSFECPDCREQRPLSEFARTSRDLDVLRDGT